MVALIDYAINICILEQVLIKLIKMKAFITLCLICFLSCITSVNAQAVASSAEIIAVFSNSKVKIIQKNGNITQTNIVNYCPDGKFTMEITRNEITRMGGLNSNSWNTEGVWKLHHQDGYNCIHYSFQDDPLPHIEPIYKRPSGILYIHGKYLENLGKADCH